MKNNAAAPSPESQQEALKMARATQKPGQTKEQTKLIAQGIEKGIALYKKQQKEKHRQADRARKKQLRDRNRHPADSQDPLDDTSYAPSDQDAQASLSQYLPWGLLLLSWIGFAIYALSGN